MEILDPDSVDRTVLFSVHNGTAHSLEDAIARHEATAFTVYADAGTVRSRESQAALLTIVKTGVRAFGRVTVVLDEGIMVTGGTSRGLSLADAVAAEGATTTFDRATVNSQDPAVVLGSARAPSPAHPVALRANWSGWVATVAPVGGPPAVPNGNVLAAIAAGALAVDELFTLTFLTGQADAGERLVSIDLWGLDDGAGDPPPLKYAPHAWWLVGLGHLGQAYAWTLSWLNYSHPKTVAIVLQDTGRTAEANRSTGVLTPKSSAGILKTRQAAVALENAGFTETVIVERRLDRTSALSDTERTYVALFGIDDVDGRKLISNIGWNYAVDASLGNRVETFDSISIHTFPGREHSERIASWNLPETPVTIPDAPAFNQLVERFDQCGLLELAGKAVGASFVGVLAAVLAIAEPIRALHGGAASDRLRYDARSHDLSVAQAVPVPNVLAAELSGPE
ncbi:hypothetical protein GCM10027052_20080 [Parafrigoribacterium mesophilum]|uniref:hypothetical protein n=1 Tax=Parafrigoribacterium mesophilum TaxID=433646 RepID=UPI0031FC18BE